MTLKKIHWPDVNWKPHPRLEDHLHHVDHALTKWAVWMRIYSKHRGLSLEQLFGLGQMAGSHARARWIPKQPQWVDLAIASLSRASPGLAKVIWQQYIRDVPQAERAAALSINQRTYINRLNSARCAIMGALVLMESRDLTERALYVRDTREKSK